MIIITKNHTLIIIYLEQTEQYLTVVTQAQFEVWLERTGHPIDLIPCPLTIAYVRVVAAILVVIIV